MNLKTPLTLLAFATMLPLSAQTLIYDDFDSADSTDLNAGNARQTGTLAPLNWNKIAGGNTAINSNHLLVDGSSPSTDYSAELVFDFGGSAALVANGGFVISFDIIALAPAIASAYGDFALTSVSGLSRPAVDTATQFGLLFRAGGDNISIRRGAGSDGEASGLTDLTGTVVLTVTTDSISNGETFTVGMTLAGNTIDLDPSDAGTDFVGTWSSSNLFMSLGDRNGSSTYDNFSVTAIPEPSAIALALGGISLAWVIRRRKAKA